MKKVAMVFLALVLIGCFTSAANSETAVTVETYQKSKNIPSEWLPVKMYIEGLATGIQLANAVMISKDSPGLLCGTDASSYIVDNIIPILDRHIEEFGEGAGGLSISVVLIIALEETFPCEE